jgi:hypothetical protein
MPPTVQAPMHTDGAALGLQHFKFNGMSNCMQMRKQFAFCTSLHLLLLSEASLLVPQPFSIHRNLGQNPTICKRRLR